MLRRPHDVLLGVMEGWCDDDMVHNLHVTRGMHMLRHMQWYDVIDPILCI